MQTENHLKHAGPHPGFVASVFSILFLAGLWQVISFTADQPNYPGPWESIEVIADYFQNHQLSVKLCAFFQFGSAIPLGIYTATMVSRLRFLGIQAAGPFIGLVGGFLAASSLVISSLLLWVLAYPGVSADTNILRLLYYTVFAIGGVGYSVPLGLLIAGIAISGGLSRKLPKWIAIPGIILGLIGELSVFALLMPGVLFLIPLTRFPAFIWFIIAGFKLPSTKPT